MSKGFFTIAQGPAYHRLAYALALSLKLSQTVDSNMSIGVTTEELAVIPAKYKEIFDNVVEIPWKDHAANSEWKLENEWKSIYMSPYDETIKLDADMFFPRDISNWWPLLEGSDGVFATQPMTYRNEPITNDYYRKVFTQNNLPNIYTAFFYFKKNDLNFELFKLAELIFNNWEKFFYDFLVPEHRPTFASTDVVFALAAKILDYESSNRYPGLNIPSFVHMKTNLQGWPRIHVTEDWTSLIQTSFNNSCELKIGNFLQTLPFHYYVKDFMTDKMISKMEKKLGI